MNFKITLLSLFTLCFLIIAQPAYAENTFYPEARETLEEGKAWNKTFFKRHNTMVKNVCRAWYPYPANKVWKVLIDTNSWKDLHSDYTDSRTLDRNQFELVKEKKPINVKGFYELVGEQIFSSYYNRRAGGVWTSYVFQRFNFPWPLKDRWVVMKIKNNESKAGKGRYRYDYKTYAGTFKELKGYWELLPIPGKPGWTEFRSEYKADPGIQVPRFITRAVYKASMRRSVKQYTKVLAGKEKPSKK